MTLQEIQKAIANDLSSAEQRELFDFVKSFDDKHAEESHSTGSERLGEVEESWGVEISSRIADIDEKRVKTVPWEVVRKKMDAQNQDASRNNEKLGSETCNDTEMAWDKEITNRIAEIDKGHVKTIPISEILRDLDQPLPKRAL